ncbi:SunI/YnzG family protein [Bacillus sp. FJAT-45350]|uniref:SunI/YnzG family protein n=1 Tax=Bacillus sp. FJAT-45350 TaxID=2011014 RepID=UPI000BB973C2|nr:hypothetical protein [Bacillus sp. FJAT-45350]
MDWYIYVLLFLAVAYYLTVYIRLKYMIVGHALLVRHGFKRVSISIDEITAVELASNEEIQQGIIIIGLPLKKNEKLIIRTNENVYMLAGKNISSLAGKLKEQNKRIRMKM